MAFQHVLTVFDGTPESQDLLDMVCRIVRPHRARLTILIVQEVPLTKALPEYKPGEDETINDLVAQAQKFADKLKVKAAVEVRYARAQGAAVLAEARIRGVDLIALLAPDMEALRLDSDAASEMESVLRNATCAVMLCRPNLSA